MALALEAGVLPALCVSECVIEQAQASCIVEWCVCVCVCVCVCMLRTIQEVGQGVEVHDGDIRLQTVSFTLFLSVLLLPPAASLILANLNSCKFRMKVSETPCSYGRVVVKTNKRCHVSRLQMLILNRHLPFSSAHLIFRLYFRF